MENTIPINPKIGFLLRKCSLIKPFTIKKLGLVPEFVEAINKSCNNNVNDQMIYEICKQTQLKLMAEGKSYKTSVNVMNKISKEVTGKIDTWREDLKTTM